MRRPASAPETPGCHGVSDPVLGDRLHCSYEPAQIVTGEWTERHRKQYDAKGAVTVRVSESANIEFLRDLPGLLSVWGIGTLTDDTPVFDVRSLEQLVLYTRCKKPLAADRLPELRDLVIDGRPGLDSLRGHPSLRRLQVHGYGAGDIAGLGAPPLLQELALHGKWRPLGLTGLASLPALREVRLTETTVDDVSVLAACPRIQHVELNVRTSDRRPVDVSPLAAMPDLRSVAIGRRPVRGLETLLGAPRLIKFGVHWGAVAPEEQLAVQRLREEVREREERLMHATARGAPSRSANVEGEG